MHLCNSCAKLVTKQKSSGCLHCQPMTNKLVIEMKISNRKEEDLKIGFWTDQESIVCSSIVFLCLSLHDFLKH